ncbi:response regulator [Flaviaesturariibacter flavus]|uniref:Response regulator n=1 Tax=Flaviaesturariibacter flavus TaxID=2502780 RepID=A0A4R1BP42_9BACT|nr:response regulator [Flaviaesturariibacter flavus]TCJ19077.1 response regulator [Flaviaesturariibacter flavus]
MKKILIIEDNLEIRENTAELLEVHQFEVMTARNGREGYLIAREAHPDMILCDIMMPGTDGRRFLELARADRRTSAIPVVFFSAGTAGPDLQQRLIGKAQGFLKKPFSEQALLDIVFRTLPGAV